MLGILYGVSVGCGNPELMTLKSVRILNQCNTIVVPVSNGKTTAFDIAKQVIDFSHKNVVMLEFPMIRDKSTLNKIHTQHAHTISNYLDKGEDVAMVNIGDISIYSTFAYIGEKIKAMGYTVEVISGVTSFCECANRLGISLTSMNEPIYIIPSSYDGLKQTIESKGTKIIMKTSKDTSKLRELLKDRHYYVCQNCGMNGETFSNTLPENTGYFTTIIVNS